MLLSFILIPLVASVVFKRHGKYIGTATNSFNLQGNNSGQAYLDILRRDFTGALTAENEGKWDAIHPSPDQYNFAGMDAVSYTPVVLLSITIWC